MRKQLMLLALLPLGAALSAAAPQDEPTALEDLRRLIPRHHALYEFDGEVTRYEHRPPPMFRYEQPDFDAWAATLEEADVDPATAPFVAIWRDTGGAIRHVLAKGDNVRLFSIDGDLVEFEDPGFQTQVGVARWGWSYEGGLLRTHRTWRMALGAVDETGRPTGPPAPTSLFTVITYDYGRGKKVPSSSRTYWSEEDRRAGRWGQKTTYGPDGRQKKTKHNPERPYPY